MNELLPLITNLATQNRDYAMFVGAGFSKDAGIMSSWDVLIETIKPLFIKENNIRKNEKIVNHDIEKWYLENEKINKLGYSQILEMMYKGDVERREYLSQFFKEKMPGDAHLELAKLVAMGVIRFIFTTNFDDLIEKALNEYNIDYDVIFSDDILKKSKSWDKVKQCRLYKLHGDYKVGGIRNTISEIKFLDNAIAEDFQYIIDRHGLIVIGYAGRDEGIMQHFMNRNPYSYPMYWQYKKLPENNSEFQLFHELKEKYQVEYSREIIYIQNSSAFKFLNDICNGIEKLNLLLKINDSKDRDFDQLIVNSDPKKLRKISYDIINAAIDKYDECLDKESRDPTFIYKFEIFQDLINQSNFIFAYLEGLLKFNCDEEVVFIVAQLLGHIIKSDWENDRYFIIGSFPYYFVIFCGSLMIKYNKPGLADILWNYKIHDSSFYSDPLLDVISKTGEGWINIGKELYKQNLTHPKYSIIRNQLRIIQLKETDIDKFDTFITLSTVINKKNINWHNGSAMFLNDSFVDIYIKYFDSYLTSFNEVVNFEKEFYEKYPYIGNRNNNAFRLLSRYLYTKYPNKN